MKKYKDNTLRNYKITTIKEVEKRLKVIEKTDDRFIDVKMYKSDTQFINNLATAIIKREKNFQIFLSSLAEISLSEQYKYNILECLNTIKEIFKENNIDSLPSFIFVHNIFVEYKYTDFSIEIKKITHIIETHKNNKILHNKINQHIKQEDYNILINEEVMLKILKSSLIDERQEIQNIEKQEKINSVIEQYYKSFTEIRK